MEILLSTRKPAKNMPHVGRQEVQAITYATHMTGGLAERFIGSITLLSDWRNSPAMPASLAGKQTIQWLMCVGVSTGPQTSLVQSWLELD